MDKQTKDKMTSSGKDDWETPNWLFRWANKRFGPIDIDVCATEENTKCKDFMSPEADALTVGWPKLATCWMNPPYSSKTQNRFVEKAHTEAQKGSTVVALLPARTSTYRWHDHVMSAVLIGFIRGRIQFVGADNGAVFPSCIVVWSQMGSRPVIASYDRDKMKEQYQ